MSLRKQIRVPFLSLMDTTHVDVSGNYMCMLRTESASNVP